MKKRLVSNCFFMLRIAFRLNRAMFFVRIPLILVNAAIPFIPIVFLRLLLNEITIGQNVQRIILYVLLMALITLVSDILLRTLETYSEIQTEITLKKIKNFLGEMVMEIPFAQMEQPEIRDFIQLAKEGSNISDILNGIAAILTGTITVIGLISVIVTLEPLIFLLILAVVGLRLLANWRNRKLWDKWRPRYAPIMRKIGYFFSTMKNTVYGKEVRLNNLGDWLYQKLDDTEHVYIKAATRHNVELQRNNSLAELAAIIQESIIYLILSYRVVFSGMPIGNFSMYMTSVNTFSSNIQNIVGAISSLLQYGLFAKDFRYCVEMAQTAQDEIKGSLSALQETDRPFVLEFRHVSFRYPQTENLVLNDISITLREGESLSLVGINGAGKTTFVKLLCRLYEPTSGQIFLNDRDISTIPYKEYAQKLGVVFQDFKLFAFSMEENITMGTSPMEYSIEECIDKSGLTQKLLSLPRGIKTNISKEFDEDGIEFSGGEGQKLVLARVLYKNAPIIILDEPTSALDPLAEYEIYARFHELVKGKCAVYISHRLSSARFTDKIAVFQDGHIAEYGSHEELMKLPQGIYASMFNMQAQYYV